MWKNYFRIALRSLIKRRLFTVVNMLGLVLGLLSFLVFQAYVISEFSFNDFHINKDRIFRLVLQDRNGSYETYLPPGYAGNIQSNFPQVESVDRVAYGIGGGLVSIPDTDLAFKENNIGFVEGDFFQNFSFELLRGNADLQQPYTAVITQELALKYFGDFDPLGKAISLSNQFGKSDFTITGVINQIPHQSDLEGDIFLSIQTLKQAQYLKGNDWADPDGLESGFVNMFLVLQEGINPENLATQLTNYIRQNPDSKENTIHLQPLADIHLGNSISDRLPKSASMGGVLVFLAMAILILIIAYVNYLNLSSANLLTRMKEIRMRKVLGAHSWQLAQQFMVETFLLMGISMALAFILFQLISPMTTSLLGEGIATTLWSHPIAIPVFLLILVGTGVISGIYVVVLSGRFENRTQLHFATQERNWGRKSLVVFQFVISIGIILCTLVIRDQLAFMQSQPLGMELSQRIVVDGPEDFKGDKSGKMEAFRQRLLSQSFIKSLAGSNSIPGYSYNFTANGITPLVPRPEDEEYNYSIFIMDEQFIPTYEIQVLAGRNFNRTESEANWNNLRKVMLNAKAAEQLGFESPESAIGQSILWGEPFEVVGVIADYHHLSLRQEIDPMILLAAEASGYFTLQLDNANLQAQIQEVEKIYKEVFPGNPFNFVFLDEMYGKQYQREQQLSQAFSVAGGLAILISCLGLFGLSAYTVQQRTKEIGIRKVLGAGTVNLLTLISKDFLLLILVAMVIAFPLAYYAMKSWQADFPYQAGFSVFTFAIAGIVSLGFALLTVGFQALKAAWANPVDSIRAE
jgi:putative ABC transport system permease protein